MTVFLIALPWTKRFLETAVIKALIVGPGAIGSLLCWHWQSSMQIEVWPHRADLKLPDAVLSDSETWPLTWTAMAESSPLEAIDLVILATKATQAKLAAGPLLNSLGHASWLICCNGMGPQQWLSDQLPGRVLWASTTEGALPDEAGRIRHRGRGTTRIGPGSDRLNPTTLQLGQWLCAQAGPLSMQWDTRIEQGLWEKLAVNAVINPITAVNQLSNGALSGPQWRPELELICTELTRIAAADGVVLPSDLMQYITNVADRTANNRSSMLQDLDAGRCTEIDHINGFLLQRARAAGLQAPRLQYWYQAVKQRESKA